MHTVIFGANGQTGRLLTGRVLEAGHSAAAVTRRPDCMVKLAGDSPAAGKTVVVSTTEYTPTTWQMVRREAFKSA